MSRLKPRRFLAILGSIVLLIGGYIGWQVYQGKQMANQYGAGKLAGTPGSKATTPGATSNPASQSEATPSPAGALSNPAWQFQATPSPAGSPANPSFEVPAPSGSSVNSSISSPSEAMSSGDYKQLMNYDVSANATNHAGCEREYPCFTGWEPLTFGLSIQHSSSSSNL